MTDYKLPDDCEDWDEFGELKRIRRRERATGYVELKNYQ